MILFFFFKENTCVISINTINFLQIHRLRNIKYILKLKKKNQSKKKSNLLY